MNAKQRRAYDHRHRTEARRTAKRYLRVHRGQPTGMLGLFATLTLSPNAFKHDPNLNWWERKGGPLGTK